jgi:hypothetical protein
MSGCARFFVFVFAALIVATAAYLILHHPGTP